MSDKENHVCLRKAFIQCGMRQEEIDALLADAELLCKATGILRALVASRGIKLAVFIEQNER